jgi:hypothetical protein
MKPVKKYVKKAGCSDAENDLHASGSGPVNYDTGMSAGNEESQQRPCQNSRVPAVIQTEHFHNTSATDHEGHIA